MPNLINNNLAVWGADNIDYNTLLQAEKIARLPILGGHVALMPDAHVGIGATVGSVIATENAVIPAAVGVDIGCGMIALRLSLKSSQLPDTLEPLLQALEVAVPAGVGKRNPNNLEHTAFGWVSSHDNHSPFSAQEFEQACAQVGTLGSGNHFVEVCVDEEDYVWLVLHSGSRGIGNKLATRHIEAAKFEHRFEGRAPLEDPDLAWLEKGHDAFDAYIEDMLWAQEYAMVNREVMMRSFHTAFRNQPGLPDYKMMTAVNCHHNFSRLEEHNGRKVWVTRKGAIHADRGRMGVIPGSMGTGTYIVRGLGEPLSYNSASHGAGRRMSRGQAKRELSEVTFREQMGEKTWQRSMSHSLIDESPGAYKDVKSVMAAQSDLVEIIHSLHSVLNYKGV